MAKEVELSTVKAAKEIRNLRDEVKALAKELGASDEEVKFISKSMTAAAQVADKFGKKINALENQVSRLKEKLKSASEANKKVADDSRRVESALVRQKNAAATAERQFLALKQKLELTGGTKVQIDSLTRSFTAFEAKMKSGRLSVNQMADAQNRWRRAQATVRREMERTRFNNNKKAMDELSKSGKISADVLNDIASSAVLTFGPLSGVGSRIIALLAIIKRGNPALIGLTLGFTALFAAMIKISVESVKAALAITKIENTLKAVTDSAVVAEAQFNFVARAALDMGLEIQSAGKDFASMLAASRNLGVTVGDIQRLFTAGAGAAKVLGLSAEETGRMFKAFEQIMSKGVVQSEEIKQQLGDVLPGALQKTADAFNVTTSELLKMMEEGGAASDVFVKEFAKVLEREFGKALPDATARLDSQWQRLLTTLSLLGNEIDETAGLSDILASSIKGWTDLLQDAFPVIEETTSMTSKLAEVGAEIAAVQAEMNALMSGESGTSLTTAELTAEMSRLNEELQKLKKLQGDILGFIKAESGVELDRFAGITRLRDLKNLPIKEIDDLRDSVKALNEQMAVLGDETLTIEERISRAEAIGNRAAAVKTAAKEIAKLNAEERLALSIQLNVKNTTEALVKGTTALALAEENLKDNVKDTTKELEDRQKLIENIQDKFRDLAQENQVLMLRLEGQDEMADALELQSDLMNELEGIDKKQLANLVEKTIKNKELNDLVEQRKDFEEAIAESMLENELLSLRIAGEKELADLIEKRAEFAGEFPELGEREFQIWLSILKVNEDLTKEFERQEKILEERTKLVEEVRDMKVENDILVLRIRGEEELADKLETRLELAKKFPTLNREELEELERLVNKNKELNEVLDEQKELEKIRKELAEDFASTISTAFENAIINGEKLSDVMQALLDDINRIILRVLVTKPLENFLTGLLTGEDPTGSKAGPGGTPFFGGVLGKLFSGGGGEEIVAGGAAAGAPRSLPGRHPEAVTRATTEGIAKLGEETTAAATAMESRLGGSMSELTFANVLAKASTTNLTGTMFELKVAATLAADALFQLAAAASAGGAGSAAGGGLSFGGGILSGAGSALGLTGPIGAARFATGGGAPGLPFSPAGFLITGSRQGGGHMEKGKAFKVHKDEIIVPQVPSVAIPADRAEGTTVNLTQNIVTPTPQDFRRSARANARLGARAAKAAFAR